MAEDYFNTDSSESEDWLSLVGGSTSNNKVSTDWMSTLFGNKEQVGAVQGTTSVISGLVGAWTGYEQMKTAQENTALAKEQFAFNKQSSLEEKALVLDAQKRGLEHHGISSDVVNSLQAQYS